MNHPTLFDLARYYRNGGLVGEDRAAITSFVALAGDASVIWRGYPGTGKTHGAKLCIDLVPDAILARVDMISKLGIWSAGMAERIRNARIVYFPEDQNASDNDEVVKVKKKWGDGDDAERAKSENYGADTEITVLPCRTFLSTAAITNDAHARSFDLESARRVVKVNTDPSEQATASVLDSMADALVHGEENVKVLKGSELIAIRAHAGKALTEYHDEIDSVRFFGAHHLKESIPKTFPETRSAWKLFEKVLLGVARWHAESEVRVDGEVFLSPQRAAEAWAFYSDILDENARKFETSDREILSVFPQPTYNGEAIAPECALDIQTIMKKLKPFGLTDPALVKRQITKLVMKGFLAEADGFRTMHWHRTGLADVANRVDWAAVIDACREHAREHLEGEALEAYLVKCDEAEGPEGMQNPLTGEWGSITGGESVLYVDAATGDYTPIGEKAEAEPSGLMAFEKE